VEPKFIIMSIDVKISQFMQALADYIGQDYLTKNRLIIGIDTRFDQLNFDIVDEIIVEQIVNDVFGMNDFTLDHFPVNVGELLSVVRERLV
jgi:hypothetical protein